MAPPATTQCKPGEFTIGPFQIFDRENVISSFNFKTRLPDTKSVSICGKYEDEKGSNLGIIFTKHLAVRGPKFDGKRWDYYNWRPETPLYIDPHVNVLQTAYTVESHIAYLSGLGVYTSGNPDKPGGIETLLRTPIAIDTIGPPMPNASFRPGQNLIFFGHIPDKCSFSSDLDVVLHEFRHLTTYEANPLLGGLYNDIHGVGMHEAADFDPANKFNDPEMGEAVEMCLSKTPPNRSPKDIGTRDVSELQCRLYIDTECHNISEHYSTFLWQSKSELIRYFQSMGIVETTALEIATDIMTILSYNTVEYIRTTPEPKDYVRAFINAFDDFLSRPDYQKKYGLGDSSTRERFRAVFTQTIRRQARLSQLIVESEEGTLFASPDAYKKEALYPIITIPVDEAVDQVQRQGIEITRADDRGRQEFYQQTKRGYPIEGAGIRFIWLQKTTDAKDAKKVIDMTVDPNKFVIPEKSRRPEIAWQTLKSKKAISQIVQMLAQQIKYGTVTQKEIEAIIRELTEATRPTSPPRLAFIPGETTPHYKFTTREAIFYVDSEEEGTNISVARTKFQ